MREYYHWHDGLSIEDVAEAWANDDPRAGHYKLYDGQQQTSTGADYHGLYDWRDIWKYREDDRPLRQDLLISVDEAQEFFEPGIIFVGRDGGIKLGEGNHRLQVAKALDMPMPIAFIFTTRVDTPTNASRAARQPGAVRARHDAQIEWEANIRREREEREARRLAAREERPRTPEEEAQMEATLDELLRFL